MVISNSHISPISPILASPAPTVSTVISSLPTAVVDTQTTLGGISMVGSRRMDTRRASRSIRRIKRRMVKVKAPHTTVTNLTRVILLGPVAPVATVVLVVLAALRAKRA